jgi:hypothetical protein
MNLDTRNPESRYRTGDFHFVIASLWRFLMYGRLIPKILNYDSGCVTLKDLADPSKWQLIKASGKASIFMGKKTSKSPSIC